MPKSRFDFIYQDIKSKIENGEYEFQQLMPSESTLTLHYSCSRNTVRRALSMLASDGYVQSMQGKGVLCIYQKDSPAQFLTGEIETFRESALRNGYSYKTRVLDFAELTVDEELSKRTGFSKGEEVLYIQRVHFINKKPLIMNHNFFLASLAEGLTAEIAGNSIYDYLENVRHVSIVSSRRVFTVEKVTPLDAQYLLLNTAEYNCLAVVSSQTFNADGVMFEYTQSRHRPDYFRFTTTAARKRQQS